MIVELVQAQIASAGWAASFGKESGKEEDSTDMYYNVLLKARVRQSLWDSCNATKRAGRDELF